MKVDINPDLSACGMYAFTAAQQSAWRQLFDRFVWKFPGKILRLWHSASITTLV